MNSLIIKLGASGDVVRTTPLLRKLKGEVTWLTTRENQILLKDLRDNLHCVAWEQRDAILNSNYDLVINLEDDLETALYLRTVRFKQLFGAYANSQGQLRYTGDSRGWFDLSLISAHGRQKADELKFNNKSSYQELIFSGLGFCFTGETYLLPQPTETGLSGDVALACYAGRRWPIKNWAYYGQLKRELESCGFTVNVLPYRASILEHIADVRNHRCVVSSDSLPMHMALGTNTRCVTLFTCTSPNEIEGYGLQTKVISPRLREFFYRRDHEIQATTAITIDEVLGAVIEKLQTLAAE